MIAETIINSAPAEYMNTKDVAAYTGLTADFWNRLRGAKGGPPYIRVSGRCVRYRRADIDAWMADRLRASTYDDRGAA